MYLLLGHHGNEKSINVNLSVWEVFFIICSAVFDLLAWQFMADSTEPMKTGKGVSLVGSDLVG